MLKFGLVTVNSATMTFYLCFRQCVCLALAMSLLSAVTCFTVGNWSLRFKRDVSTVPPPAADDGDKLVYSTKTMLQSMSFKWFKGSKASAEQFSTVFQEDSYVINSFDVSFQEGLAFYGIDDLFARSIGGSNYLNIGAKKNMDIKFENQFSVDWLDHNVLIYREKALHMVSLMTKSYSRKIYNGSQNVRNILVSSKGYFFAWIDNDNNILKSAKDGSGLTRVHTEKTKIFCMTIDESTQRFFFYIGGQGFTKQRSVQRQQRPAPLSHNQPQQTGVKMQPIPVQSVQQNDNMDDEPKTTGYYFVLYSKDFAGRYPPEREGSVMVDGDRSEPVQVAKYKDFVFVILQDRIRVNGDLKYRLGQVMRDGRFEELVVNPNWRITSVKVAGKVSGIDLCGRDLKRCPYLCVHMSDSQARCICKDDAPGCKDAMMVPPKINKATKSPAEVRDKFLWIIATFMVLLPVCGALAYFLYAHYLVEPKEDSTDSSKSTTGGSQAMSDDAGKTTNTTSTADQSSTAGQQGEQPQGTALDKVKVKANAAWGALVSWAGMGSSDVSSSGVDNQPNAEQPVGANKTITADADSKTSTDDVSQTTHKETRRSKKRGHSKAKDTTNKKSQKKTPKVTRNEANNAKTCKCR